MKIFANAQIEFSRVIATGRGWGQGVAVFLIYFEYLVQRLAEFFIDLNFLVAMNPAVHQAGKTADVALVGF